MPFVMLTRVVLCSLFLGYRMYTGQHKLCTDTNTVLDIVKATPFYRKVMRYIT